MAHLIHLKTFSEQRGNLTVIENQIPFRIKRIFYIYGVDESVRGGHRHKTQCLFPIYEANSFSTFFPRINQPLAAFYIYPDEIMNN